MTADDTRPEPIPALPPEPGSGSETTAAESVLRPRDRRILQALALLCAVPALLALHWVDEKNNIEKNLKPPEKVSTVPPGGIGELVGARWKVAKRAKDRPPVSSARQDPGEVTELRLVVGVRPGNAAAATTVGSYGLVYRLVDDEGREWSASATTAQKPRAGVATLVTVTATVPRTRADSLELEIRAPKTSRKEGEPLPSLRFER